MRLIGRNPRRFTKAESFRLFIEGVRSLQLYDKEADNEEPNRYSLDKFLKESEECFRKCVDDFPNDMLPLYYFGIVLTLRGQVEQAHEIRETLLGAPTKAVPDSDTFFHRSAKVFEKVAVRASGDLREYAKYNQALALAKTGPIRRPALQTP